MPKKKDVVTGIWESTAFEKNGVDYITSYIKLDGYGATKDTRRANSIWGDVENIRRAAGGHTKADLYSGSDFIGTMTLHKKLDFFGNYGSFLDGDLKLNIRTGKATLWDDDLGSHWVAKMSYDI